MMQRNLFGEVTLTPEDYIPLLLNELSLDSFHELIVKEETAQGFSTNTVIPNQGLYVIYKNEQPIYVGCSNSSIHKRIGRFLSAVRGTERDDENHSAAYKYIDVFGRDLSGVSIKVLSLTERDLFGCMDLEDVEIELIKSIKPLFNNETHHDYVFQKGIKVVSLTGEKVKFL